MFWGFVLTAMALVFMVIWSLFQIRRVDRIIEKVDREQAKNNAAEKK